MLTRNTTLMSHTYSSILSSALSTCFIGTDDPIVLGQVIESLPALPSCELMDPADDQTLPLLIEALEKRQRVRQIMSEQLNKTGVQPSLIPCCC